MKRNFILFKVFLIVVLCSLISFPCQVAAFRTTLDRGGVTVNTSAQGSSPIPTTPSTPAEQPVDNSQQSGNQTQQSVNQMTGSRSTISRSGVYVPPASSSSEPSETDPEPSPSQDPQDPEDPDSSPNLPEAPQAPAWLTADEAQAYVWLNELRLQNNLPSVSIDAKLVEVARMKAQDMADNNYFSHVSPTYGSVSQMLRNAGVVYKRAGENLSKAGNIKQAHLQLEYSTKGHREIMLNSGYNKVGIGVVCLKNVPGIVLVEIFTD